tara:strand:- start:15 stop:602 length:588 start_codon:yes stop_codon:yes gene_type:complete
LATSTAVFSQIDYIHIIENRIIPRMREIELCGRVSEHMFNKNLDDGIKSFQLASLKLEEQEFYTNVHSRQITDPILDSGIAMVRVMLQFLGVSVHFLGHFNPYKHSDGNIILQSFGRENLVLTNSEHNYVFRILSADEIEAIRITGVNGNKGVAHLTIHETKSIPLNTLAIACSAMIKLLNFWLIKRNRSTNPPS